MAEVIDIDKQQKAEREAEGLNGTDPEAEGKSIEDLAGELPEDEEGQKLLDFGDHVNLKLGGKRPTESKIKFRTIQRDIKGQIGDKGDDETYVFIVVGRLQDIQTPIKRDEVGRVISKKRVHVLDPVDVQVLPDDVAEDILTRLE
jgi:hypothetical protein